MVNKWIEHIKQWAKKNNYSYSCALTNYECRDAYRNNVSTDTKIIKYKLGDKRIIDDPNLKKNISMDRSKFKKIAKNIINSQTEKNQPSTTRLENDKINRDELFYIYKKKSGVIL